MSLALSLLFALLIGHALADFSLQTDAMAKGKNWNNKTTPPPGARYTPCWPYWLTSHALIHGGVVWLITGIPALGMAETILHWQIDFHKCDNRIGVHADQALHLFCKVIWVVFAVLVF